MLCKYKPIPDIAVKKVDIDFNIDCSKLIEVSQKEKQAFYNKLELPIKSSNYLNKLSKRATALLKFLEDNLKDVESFDKNKFGPQQLGRIATLNSYNTKLALFHLEGIALEFWLIKDNEEEKKDFLTRFNSKIFNHCIPGLIENLAGLKQEIQGKKGLASIFQKAKYQRIKSLASSYLKETGLSMGVD